MPKPLAFDSAVSSSYRIKAHNRAPVLLLATSACSGTARITCGFWILGRSDPWWNSQGGSDRRNLIEKGCSKLGLTLNRNKCELITVDPEVITENILSQFVHVSLSTAKLLGAPLSSEEALTSTLDICTTDLGVALDKLPHNARQDALLKLRCSLGSPRLMHILRSSPAMVTCA